MFAMLEEKLGMNMGIGRERVNGLLLPRLERELEPHAGLGPK